MTVPVFKELPPLGRPNQKKVFRYATQLQKVREFPNTWALVAVFDEGSPKYTSSRVQTVSGELWRYLTRTFPLEVWEVSRRKVPDSWCRREIYVKYHGEVSPEVAAEMRAARRAIWAKGRENGAEKRAAREALIRIRALAANREIRLLSEHQRNEANGR